MLTERFSMATQYQNLVALLDYLIVIQSLKKPAIFWTSWFIVGFIKPRRERYLRRHKISFQNFRTYFSFVSF